MPELTLTGTVQWTRGHNVGVWLTWGSKQYYENMTKKLPGAGPANITIDCKRAMYWEEKTGCAVPPDPKLLHNRSIKVKCRTKRFKYTKSGELTEETREGWTIHATEITVLNGRETPLDSS